MASLSQSFPFGREEYKGPGEVQGPSAQRASRIRAEEKPAIIDDLVGFAEVGDQRFFERHRRCVHFIPQDPVTGVVWELRNLLPEKLDKVFCLAKVNAGF
jgi:hypothetical protein